MAWLLPIHSQHLRGRNATRTLAFKSRNPLAGDTGAADCEAARTALACELPRTRGRLNDGPGLPDPASGEAVMLVLLSLLMAYLIAFAVVRAIYLLS